MPVHLMGFGVDIAGIKAQIAAQTNPPVLIEDFFTGGKPAVEAEALP